MSTRTIRGLLLDGRVFVDLADLTAEMRRRAEWWLAETKPDLAMDDDRDLTEAECQMVVVGQAIAMELEDRADQFDVQGVRLATELAEADRAST